MIGRRTFGFFVVASVLFGGTFVGAKAGLEYFPPLLFVALRFDVAAIALLGYVFVRTAPGERLPRTRGDLAGIVATGVFAIGLTNALLFVGQQYATSGVAAIVFSLSPVLTPLFAAALLSDEHLSARGTIGVLLGLLGVGLVVSPDPANIFAGNLYGQAILFAGTLSGALGSVLILRADGELSSTVRTAWGLPLAAGLSHAFSLAAGESVGSVILTPAALLALGYVSIFAGAVAYIAYFGLLDSAGAIHTNLVFYVVPVVATLGGWAILGETISSSALAGFLIILVGFAVLGSESVTLPKTPGWIPGRRADQNRSMQTSQEPTGFESD